MRYQPTVPTAEPMIGRIQARLHDGPLWRLGNLLSTARFRAWQLRQRLSL